MKKLSIVLVVMLALLAGCIQIIPPADIPATSEPSPTVTEQAAPAEADTPEPAVSVTPAVTPDTEEPQVLPVVNDKTLRYENEHIQVDISCPEISGLLDSTLQQEINDSAYSDLKDMIDEIEQASIDDPAPASTYYIDSEFTVRRNDGIFLSISEEIGYYNGGATTGTDLKFINIKSTATGQRLALQDLFSPGVDFTTLINDRISDMIAANPDMSDFTFSSISSNQGFYLTDSALVIAFQSYIISPGVYGPPEFAIPFADLGDNLIPELRQ